MRFSPPFALAWALVCALALAGCKPSPERAAQSEFERRVARVRLPRSEVGPFLRRTGPQVRAVLSHEDQRLYVDTAAVALAAPDRGARAARLYTASLSFAQVEEITDDGDAAQVATALRAALAAAQGAAFDARRIDVYVDERVRWAQVKIVLREALRSGFGEFALAANRGSSVAFARHEQFHVAQPRSILGEHFAPSAGFARLGSDMLSLGYDNASFWPDCANLEAGSNPSVPLANGSFDRPRYVRCVAALRARVPPGADALAIGVETGTPWSEVFALLALAYETRPGAADLFVRRTFL